MKISSINNSGYYAFDSVNTMQKKSNFNFKAINLSVCKEMKLGVRGEAKSRFNSVMQKFKNILLKDKTNGTLYVKEATPNSLVETRFGKEKANLNLSLDEFNVDFFYNIESTENEIVRDLCTTFKYLIGKKEFAQKNLQPKIETDPILDNVIYDLTHYP